MPAAAVIPAPIAYIKVVAVKKLVVGFLAEAGRSLPHKKCGACVSIILLVGAVVWLIPSGCGGNPSPIRSFTLKKLECSKQAYRFAYISME